VPSAVVSLVPNAEWELDFLALPFMSHQIPPGHGMRLDAADVLRKALEDSTPTTGYKLTLDRLKIHSMLIQSDWLIVDVDGHLSVK